MFSESDCRYLNKILRVSNRDRAEGLSQDKIFDRPPEEILDWVLDEVDRESVKIYLDNLHSPFIELPRSYLLPSVSLLEGPDRESAAQYLRQLMEIIPNFLSGYQILPEPRPRKELGKIFLVKEIQTNFRKNFLDILVLDMAPLGGTPKEAIRAPGKQNYSPKIETNRVYFQNRIICVDSVIQKDDLIFDFDAYEMREWIDDLSVQNFEYHRIKPFSEIFDEPDYTRQEKLILKMFGIDSQNWKLGNIFHPLGIDHLSLSFRSLEFSGSRREFIWKKIFPLIWHESDSEITKETREFWDIYLKSFSISRSYSDSGNPRWEVLRSKEI
jgi:hypothetical protein